ncbi:MULTISPECIES: DUF2249 domain-containing protein [unclassified Duganella]|uniref:DUF2249 domain-containing protein n=1 Tax=unclassified Duganella TaxID=2636909 RepID=UPI0006F1C397|nr:MULTISPECIES: DUF2249 domain-containing protein [unclassified Duganella]KQV59705.1 hypothetical protein ASD07_23050 [Duganella sp. Root336D2]KRB87185.1 hypothetical protein ASE26_07250 [Duganella sp. Root198D2]
MSAPEILLELCGMVPPEPMERVLEALDLLQPGQHIRMVIDREPVPLYRILEKNGYRHATSMREDYIYEILITHAD